MVQSALNRMRCGKVRHLREWAWGGYEELIGSRHRFRILDVDRLLRFLGTLGLRRTVLVAKKEAKNRLQAASASLTKYPTSLGKGNYPGPTPEYPG
jgi:hypothetical protein